MELEDQRLDEVITVNLKVYDHIYTTKCGCFVLLYVACLFLTIRFMQML